MRTSRPVTPDEKLLHVIEKSRGGDKSIRKRINLFFKKISLRKISLPSINKVLTWGSVIATIGLVAYFIKEEKLLQRKFTAVTADIQEKDYSHIGEAEKDLPNFSAYLAHVNRDNPFHLLPESEKAKEKKVEAALDFNLVGILWSDKPQAIIEDKASQKNYLVYEGDMIDKFKVSAITQSEVKLISEDGEKILR